MLNKLRRHFAPLLLASTSATSHAFHVHKRSAAVSSQRIVSLPMAGESPEGTNSLLDRVLSPKIDDRGLPLSDATAAQIIGPALQVFWLTLVGAPRPTWLIPHYDTTFVEYRGSLPVPTLIHGAALSCCWLLGALVARAYEEDAIDPMDAWPDDMVLAEGLHRYGVYVTEPVTRPTATWAGLRTFSPDRSLVIGPDPYVDDFFWCAGQGGYGIQSSPAASQCLADLVLMRKPKLGTEVIDALSPTRFS